MRLGRNDPCHCGSGKKYKKCHMQTDANEQRQAQNISCTNDWVSFHTKRLADSTLTRALETPAVRSAKAQWFGSEQPKATDVPFTHHALFDLAVTESGPLITQSNAEIPETTAAEVESFKNTLATSHLSLLEVTACKRDRGVRLQNRLTGEEGFVRDAALAGNLEPLEVVLGRMTQWNDEYVLLPGWEKVRFRGRKALITHLQNEMVEAGLEEDDRDFRIAWLRREAVGTAQRARKA